jgi:hypothetical protein
MIRVLKGFSGYFDEDLRGVHSAASRMASQGVLWARLPVPPNSTGRR